MTQPVPTCAIDVDTRCWRLRWITM